MVDGLKQVDRHKHVAGLMLVRCSGLLDKQGADADQFSVSVYEGGTAPVGVRGRREYRFVKQVLPVARELAFGHDLCGDGAAAVSVTGYNNRITRHGCRGLADFNRCRIEGRQSSYQAETGLVVVGHRLAGHFFAVRGSQGDRGGFTDQIPDRENEAVLVDDHPIPGPLRSQRLGCHGIRRDLGAQGNHRRAHSVEIEAQVVGIGSLERAHAELNVSDAVEAMTVTPCDLCHVLEYSATRARAMLSRCRCGGETNEARSQKMLIVGTKRTSVSDVEELRFHGFGRWNSAGEQCTDPSMIFVGGIENCSRPLTSGNVLGWHSRVSSAKKGSAFLGGMDSRLSWTRGEDDKAP